MVASKSEQEICSRSMQTLVVPENKEDINDDEVMLKRLIRK